jgi:hypothetical protein
MTADTNRPRPQTGAARRHSLDPLRLARIFRPRENLSVAKGLLPNTRRQIGKFHRRLRHLVAHEPAFLENSSRRMVFRVAQRKQSSHADLSSHIDYRGECLGGKALAPGIPGQNVSRHRFMRCLKPETGASKQLAVGT